MQVKLKFNFQVPRASSPQTGYYADLFEMAAALMESLLMNHPFVDGNKRVAFFATDVFLRLNGWKMSVDGDEAHRFIVGGLEAGSSDFQSLLHWIAENAAESNESPTHNADHRQGP